MGSNTSKFYSSPFDSLPDEIVGSITEYLDEAQLPIVRMTNRKFAKALKDIRKIPPKALMECYAGIGNLKFIKYLYKNKCPWDEKACEMAAYIGNLNCLRFLHENGCPWNEKTIGTAGMHAQLNTTEIAIKGRECFDYAKQHGCPGWRNYSEYEAWDKSKVCNVLHPYSIKYDGMWLWPTVALVIIFILLVISLVSLIRFVWATL